MDSPAPKSRPVWFTRESSGRFDGHETALAVADKAFKLVQWSLLVALLRKANQIRPNTFLYLVTLSLETLLVVWLTLLISNNIFNRLAFLSNDYLPKLLVGFLLGIVTYAVNFGVQRFLGQLFEQVISIQLAR